MSSFSSSSEILSDLGRKADVVEPSKLSKGIQKLTMCLLPLVPLIASVLFQPALSIDEIYSRIFGFIELQTDSAIEIDRSQAITSSIKNLLNNTCTQLFGYMAAIGAGQDQVGEITKKIQNQEPIFVDPKIVDLHVANIHALISSNSDWRFKFDINLQDPDFFVLGNKNGECLSTAKSSINDGSHLELGPCEFSHLGNKLFKIEDDGRIYLVTSRGLMCLTYDQYSEISLQSIFHGEQKYYDKFISIYPKDSDTCKTQRKITAFKNFKGGYSLYDTIAHVLCREDASQGIISGYGFKNCQSSFTSLDVVIPIILNDYTGNQLVPPYSFSDISPMIDYFIKIAVLHLKIIKEGYTFGDNTEYWKSTFDTVQEDYINFITKIVPVYRQYLTCVANDIIDNILLPDYQYALSLRAVSLEPRLYDWTLE